MAHFQVLSEMFSRFFVHTQTKTRKRATNRRFKGRLQLRKEKTGSVWKHILVREMANDARVRTIGVVFEPRNFTGVGRDPLERPIESYVLFTLPVNSLWAIHTLVDIIP